MVLETLEIRSLMATDMSPWYAGAMPPPSQLIGEGEADIRAALSYEFYAVNVDGTLGRNLDPNPDDSVYEAVVGRGEEFVVRTLVQDVRSNPKGVYSTYSDLRYTNRDGSTSEKMQVQWSDVQVLEISRDGREGSFRLQYGSETTEPIELVFDGLYLDDEETASLIANRIESLSSMGVDYVHVERSLNSSNEVYRFEITYLVGLARQDIVGPTVVDNQLVPSGGSDPVSITISDITNATSSSDKVLLGATDFTPPVTQDYQFYNGPRGVYFDVDQTKSATRVLARVGGFSSSYSFPSEPSRVRTSHDVRFFASEVGTIDLQYGIATNSNGSNEGILLFDNSSYLTELQVRMPSAEVRIEEPIIAADDSLVVDIGSSEAELDVLANDFAFFPLQIVSVTQPSRGTVTISPDGTKLRYELDPSSTDPVSFTYLVHDGNGNLDDAIVDLTFGDLSEDPTLDPIDDVSLKYNPAEKFILLTGISAGGSESQPLRVFAYSSDPDLVPDPEVTYTSPFAIGGLRIKPNRWSSGTSDITVIVEDGGRDGDLETEADNKYFTRSFTVTVAPPTTSHNNPSNAFDVNDDGSISPLDVLKTIDIQNMNEPSYPVGYLDPPAPFPDVDSDGLVSPIDSLLIVDYLNQQDGGGEGSGGSHSQKVELSYTITDVNGQAIDSALVGSEFFVNIFVKDLRTGGRGVGGSYLDLLVFNGDGSTQERVRYVDSTASTNYPNGSLDGDRIDFGGGIVLQSFGGFSNSLNGYPSGVSLLLRSIRFEASEAGPLELDLSPTDPNDRYLGTALFSDTSDYLNYSEIKLPPARSFEIVTDFEARDDSFDVTEDAVETVLDVLANDPLPVVGNCFIVYVSQPAFGAVVISEDGQSARYQPATNYSGTEFFTYTIQNEQGLLSTATVTVEVAPVNDPPTIDSVADDSVPEDIGVFELDLTGITAGGGESFQSLQVTATSSQPEIISIEAVDYTSPDATGKLRLKAGLASTGSSVIEIVVEDDLGAKTTIDFTVSLTPRTIDFGDAPSSGQSGFAADYPTLLVDDGARHVKGELFLGEWIDGEIDGQPEFLAVGDDETRWADEDGIQFPVSIIGTGDLSLTNTFIAHASAPGFIDAFVDFNRDGDWDDLGERIADAHPVSPGRNLITFDVPTGIGSGVTYARFRLSSVGGLDATGLAQDGEVEDHAILLLGTDPSVIYLNVTQLGAHSITVEGDQAVITVGGLTCWQAPISVITSLIVLNDAGEVISEIHDFTEEFPGTLQVDDSTGEIELTVALPSLALQDNSTFGTVNTIDLTNPGANELSFDPSDIETINEDKNLMIVMGVVDVLNTVNVWVVGPGKEVDGRYVQTYSYGDIVLEVMSERPWRNEVNPLDVDANRGIDPLDVLVLINTINEGVFDSGELPNRLESALQVFLDPNGDENLGPLDVLVLINHINSSPGNGEGEGETSRVSQQATDRLFAQWAYTPDLEDWQRSASRLRFPARRTTS